MEMAYNEERFVNLKGLITWPFCKIVYLEKVHEMNK